MVAGKKRAPTTEKERHESERTDEILTQFIHRWENNLKQADPLARVVELPGAHHYMFLSEQASVLKHIQAFLETLPK